MSEPPKIIPHRPPEPDPLEAQLTAHFERQLGGQLGAARAAFEQRPAAPARRRHSARHWAWWFIPAAAAACLALAVIWPRHAQVPPHESVASQPAPLRIPGGSLEEPPQFEAATYYRQVDAGPVVLATGQGEAPARRIYQQTVHDLRWFDPQENATIRMTVPQEHVVYVNLQPY